MTLWWRVALRALAALVAVALVAALVAYTGRGAMLAALSRVAAWLPLLLALEAAVVATNGFALRALLRRAGGNPTRYWSVVYFGHVFAVLLPAGRLVAEGWKALRIARETGAGVASAGAVALQAAVLLANAVVALVTFSAVAHRCGRTLPTLVVGVFSLGMIALGAAVALAGRARVGQWLGARMTFAREAGPAFDRAYGDTSRALGAAVGYECLGRAAQLAQVMVLRYALGVGAGVEDTLASYGLMLAGAAAGDLLPAQLGATDAALTLAAPRVGLTAADALALTLSLHGAQAGLALLAAGVVLMRSKVE